MPDEPEILYCANHPQTPTTLHCNRCEKPICPKCAVQTPTGYRCRECVRGQQKVFDTAAGSDYIILFVVIGLLSFLGSLLAYRLSWFVIFLAPLWGGVMAEAGRFAVRKRRAKRLFQLAAAAAVLGSLPMMLILLFSLSFYAILWEGVYLILMTSTVYYRLSGIHIGI